MSGASVPLRSLWLGEGLASATTEDSGRNSDATIRAPPGRLQEPLSLAQDEGSSAGGGGRRRRFCRNNAARQARGHGRGGDCSQYRTSLQPSVKATAGPALSPTRPSNSGTPSSRLRYSLDVPDNTLLTHRPRQHATWLIVPE